MPHQRHPVRTESDLPKLLRMADRFESRIVVWLAALFCCGCGTPPAAQFVRQIPWADQGEWLKVDSHIHTRFSDGEHQPVEIAARAIEHGCDAIAFTDHADSNLTAATPEYFEAIEVARRQFPGLIILAGLEWNVPPDGGDTHAVLLVPPGSDEEPLLREFKQQFDDLTVNEADTAKPLIHTNQRYLNGLQFLASRKTGDGTRPLLVFEHVGRKSESTVTSLDLLRLARTTNDVAIGLSGAPGHLADNSGSYRGNVRLIDRWDPAVAEIGGVWDQLLQAGDDVWGAGAPSDFHNPKLDYWPGQFSETWVRVPERTPEGVLAGLRAGTYFGVHGHIARQVDLRVEAPGLARPARAGEVLEVLPQQSVEVVLALDAPARDWESRPSAVDAVDLIAITSAGARVVETSIPDVEGVVHFASQIVPRGGVVFRARGRSPARDGLSYVFYTNPIRIQEAEIGYWNIARLSTVLKKLRENWRPLSAAVLLMLAGLGLLGRPLARTGRGRGSRPRRLSTLRARRVFFAGAIGLVGVAIYASLIPFQYAETTLSDAWVQLRQSAAPGVHLSRADIAINVLIGIPLAFCGLSSLGTPRSLGIGRASIAALLTVITCGGFAVGLELSQCWFPPRVPSASDVAAQTSGAALGTVIWLLLSRRITLFVEDLFRRRTLVGRRDWVLQFYVSVFLLWHWLPLDLVLSPQELLDKLRRGYLELIPFSFQFKSRSDEIYSYVSALLRALPVGVWAALAWNRSGRGPREWSWAFLLGAVAITAAEGGQIVVQSRVASITTWLFGLVGMGLSAALALAVERYLVRRTSLESGRPWHRSASLWVLASMAWSALLAVVFWAPFQIIGDDVLLSARFRSLLSPPLTILHQGSDVRAMFHLLKNTFWCLPWGGLLGMVAVADRERDLHGRVWMMATLFWVIAWSAILELGQCLLVDHAGDSADILARVFGASVGLVIVRLWASNTTARKT